MGELRKGKEGEARREEGEIEDKRDRELARLGKRRLRERVRQKLSHVTV